MNKLEIENKLKDNKLPEGWAISTLENVSMSIKKNAPKNSSPYLEIGDIDIKTKRYSLKDKKSPNHCLIANQKCLVISKVRPTRGAISLIREQFLYVSPAFLVLKSTIDFEYLYFYLSRKKLFNFLFTRETGTTYPSVHDKDILEFKLMVPSHLSEQQKIADILETVDETIDKTDAIVEKYKRIKQGLMQDLLTRGIDENGQIRSEKTHRFKDSPLGRIPEEWEVVEFGEVCGFINGRAFKPNEWSKAGLPIIRIENLNNINASYNYCNFKVDKKYWISEGDLLLSWSGTPGTSFGMFIWNRGEAILNQHIFKVIIKKLLDKKYLYYKFNSMLDKMINQSHGSAGLKHITKSYLDKIKLAISISLYEQRRIASILFQIDETIEKEQNYKQKLEKIKQGLMEDLLTGKVRVNHLIKEGVESV